MLQQPWEQLAGEGAPESSQELEPCLGSAGPGSIQLLGLREQQRNLQERNALASKEHLRTVSVNCASRQGFREGLCSRARCRRTLGCTQSWNLLESPTGRSLMRAQIMIQALSFIIKKSFPQCQASADPGNGQTGQAPS